MSTSYLDSDGWYRQRPVQTLDELQKICESTSTYDQAFCKPAVIKIKHKRTVKYASPSIALNENDRRERKFVKRITKGRAIKRKCDKVK